MKVLAFVFFLGILPVCLAGEGDLSNPCGEAFSKTIRHYNENAERYERLHQNVSPQVAALRNWFLSQLPDSARILDLGAAHGRDTGYFLEQGHEVLPLEPSDALADLLEARHELKVDRRGVQEMDYQEEFDGIWAMAVLHHIPKEDLASVFRRLAQALKPGGIVHASFIQGVGSPDQAEFDNKGRFWSRISERSLREILAGVSELEILEDATSTRKDDYHGGRAPSDSMSFLNLHLRKRTD